MAVQTEMQDQMPEGTADDMGGAPEQNQGYVIEITVKSDGTYSVSKEDIQQEAEEENAVAGGAPPAEQEQSYPSIGEALKAVIDIVKANPVNESEQAGFEAGYGAEAPTSKAGNMIAGGMMGGR